MKTHPRYPVVCLGLWHAGGRCYEPHPFQQRAPVAASQGRIIFKSKPGEAFCIFFFMTIGKPPPPKAPSTSSFVWVGFVIFFKPEAACPLAPNALGSAGHWKRFDVGSLWWWKSVCVGYCLRTIGPLPVQPYFPLISPQQNLGILSGAL